MIKSEYEKLFEESGELLKLGKYAELVKCHAKQVHMCDQDIDTLFRIKLSQSEHLLKCCNKAIELNPLDLNAYYYKGEALTVLGRQAEAEVYYTKACYPKF